MINSLFIIPGTEIQDLESGFEKSKELKLLIPIEEHSAKNTLLRLSIGFLEATECYSEVIRVCGLLISG